jgi:hypothetical protein
MDNGHSPMRARLTLDEALGPANLFTGDHRLSHVLVLTFNADLAFFERWALSQLRRRGAIAAVVSDANAVNADPWQVSWAGRSWLDGRVACKSGGRFHPKLYVAIGEEQASVIVGSGNLTTGGWYSNAELWVELTGTPDATPTCFAQLIDFLQQLPEQLSVGAGVRDALADTAAALSAFVPNSPGPMLVSSVSRPIFDQLPEGPVDELVVYAPFQDERATTIDRLIERFEPEHVEIFVQARYGSFDPGAVARVASRHNAHVQVVDDARYHHGKLVEWATGAQRAALLGSPNLSYAGLQSHMGTGGNCELALIATLENTLRPPAVAEPVDLQTIKQLDPTRQQPDEPTPLLLSATLTATGVNLVLARTYPEPLVIEAGLDDLWEPITELPANTLTADVTAALAPTTALRATNSDNRHSPIVFVSDPAKVTTPLQPTGTARPRPDPTKIFQDLDAWHRLFRDLAAIRTTNPSGSPGGTRTQTPTATERTQRYLTWDEHLSLLEDTLGDNWARYGLLLPLLHERHVWGGNPAPPPPDDPDKEVDGPPPPPPPPPPDDRNEEERRLLAKRIGQFVAQRGDSAPGRVIALRFLLRGAAEGVFAQSEDWLGLLAQLLTDFAALEYGYDDERNACASASAVAISVGDLWYPARASALVRRIDRATQRVRPLLVHAETSRIEQLCMEIANVPGFRLNPDLVIEMATRLSCATPAEDVVDALDQLGTAARIDAGCVRIADPATTHPVLRAVECLGLAHGSPVAISITNGSEAAWVFWSDPYLVVVDENQYRVRGQVFARTGVAYPWDWVTSEHRLPAQYQRHEWTGTEPPDDVRSLITQHGLLIDRPVKMDGTLDG